MPTARNARGIDVVAYAEDGHRYLGIQVKALSKRVPVPLGDDLDRIRGDYWVVVCNAATVPVCHILLPDEVRALAHRGEKDGRVSHWLQPAAYGIEAFRERWDRIAGP